MSTDQKYAEMDMKFHKFAQVKKFTPCKFYFVFQQLYKIFTTKRARFLSGNLY